MMHVASSGGKPTELGERFPEKVEQLVYLAAYLLADGETIFQHATTDAGSALGASLRPDEKNGVIAVADEGFGAALASGCSAADIEAARSKARPDRLLRSRRRFTSPKVATGR